MNEGIESKIDNPFDSALSVPYPSAVKLRDSFLSYSWREQPSIELQPSSSLPREVLEFEDLQADIASETPQPSADPAAQPLLPSSVSFHVRFASKKLLSPWFPEVDPDNPRAKTWRTWHSRREVLLITCCVLAGAVLIVNVSATIVFKVRWETTGDLGRIYKGDCDTSQRLSLGLHLVINILSTLLFSSSNLCMQLRVSPTRTEVDVAPSKLRWVDIGVPSIR